MTDVMGKLAGRRQLCRRSAIGRKDEVGRMADAVQSFKDAAIDKIRVEGEAGESAASRGRAPVR